jgi:hypothetical protein
MDFPIIIPDTVDLAGLPENTVLYQLIANCHLDHELVLSECSDGALIMECLDCPFHRVLDEVEEDNIQGNKSLSFPLSAS